jgi:SAM-dependent methyltransferase
MPIDVREDISFGGQEMKDFLKRVFLKFITGYKDPQKYWNRRWELGLKSEEWSAEMLKRYIEMLSEIMCEYKCNNILEIGCGRAQLRGLPGYLGMDFSVKALQRSGLTEFIFADVTNHIPLSDEAFDAVLVRYVLLHVLPEHIEKAASEISRVAKKIVILCEPPYKRGETQSSIHSFNHNLLEIFRRHFVGRLIFIDETTEPGKISWRST